MQMRDMPRTLGDNKISKIVIADPWQIAQERGRIHLELSNISDIATPERQQNLSRILRLHYVVIQTKIEHSNHLILSTL